MLEELLGENPKQGESPAVSESAFHCTLIIDIPGGYQTHERQVNFAHRRCSLGMIGYLAGILFQKGILKARKLDLCIYGFLSVFLIFGGIMNPASVLIAFYISGAPVDLVQATSTVIFLWILSRPLLEKLERVKRKYGLLQTQKMLKR